MTSGLYPPSPRFAPQPGRTLACGMPSKMDPENLRHGQYATDANLSARLALHRGFSTNPQIWYHWLFEQLGLQRFERLLEIGCGNASFWIENRDRLPGGLHSTLCDLSEGMLAKARLGLDAPGFRFTQINAATLPFAAGSFDVGMAHHMLYHVRDPAETLGELARVIAPGGSLFAATNGISHLAELDALLVGVGETPGVAALSFGLENGPGFVRQAFEGVLVARYPNGLEVRESQPVVDYLLSAHELSEEQCAEVRSRVDAAIAKRGHFAVSIDVGLIMARRA